MANIYFLNREKLCVVCKNMSYIIVDSKPLCLEHYVKQEYNDNGCGEAYLEMLSDRIYDNKEISEEDFELLKEIKKQFPELAKKFPNLFALL